MTKCTMLIQVGTFGDTSSFTRSAGFSESWYTTQPFSTSLITAMVNLAQLRAALLPQTGTIVGFRFQDTDGITSSASISQPVALPGTAGSVTDVPSIGVKVQLNSTGGGANRKQMILRAVPDENIIAGSFKPVPAYRTALTNYLSELVSHPWQWKGRDLAQTSYPILTIDAAGLYQLAAASVIPDNTMVQVLRTTNSAERRKGGFYLNKVLTPLTGTFLGWNHGPCTKGRFRAAGIVFPGPAGFVTPPVGRAVSKKVGRPFEQYRGRKSVASPG